MLTQQSAWTFLTKQGGASRHCLLSQAAELSMWQTYLLNNCTIVVPNHRH